MLRQTLTFCRRRGLAYGTVAAWRSMERRVRGRFVEVEATCEPHAGAGARSSSTALCAELVLPGGAVLRIYQAGDKGGAA